MFEAELVHRMASSLADIAGDVSLANETDRETVRQNLEADAEYAFDVAEAKLRERAVEAALEELTSRYARKEKLDPESLSGLARTERLYEILGSLDLQGIRDW